MANLRPIKLNRFKPVNKSVEANGQIGKANIFMNVVMTSSISRQNSGVTKPGNMPLA